MKLFIILFFISNSIFAQTKKEEEFILKGRVNYPTDRYIYFVQRDYADNRFLDSTRVIKGKFTYKGIIYGYTDRFYIKSDPNNLLNDDSINNVNVPIDNSIMSIDLKMGEFSKYKLKGCKACDYLKAEENKNKAEGLLSEKYQSIIQDSLSSVNTKRKYEILDSILWNKRKIATLRWCRLNPTNVLTPIKLCAWGNDFIHKELKIKYNTLNKIQKNSYYGKILASILERKYFQEIQIGKEAPAFEKIGFDSSEVKLKEISKKGYVLLDFWASWCVPCRASHPHLIELFKKYNPFNFNIVGISDDDKNIAAWKKAIESDSIFLWFHVLRGYDEKKKINDMDLTKKYFIDGYPTKILINEKGIIVGRYGADKMGELQLKLKEIYKF
jgi:thiol-disulfide isomerase/thioredoxin